MGDLKLTVGARYNRDRKKFSAFDATQAIVDQELSGLGRTARSGWDGLQHIAASLQSGYGSAATITERHGSAARGNPVYECGTLVGKVMRLVFMLDYLVNPEFRREVHRLLAQGESLHALQRALLTGRIEARHGRAEDGANAITGIEPCVTSRIPCVNGTRSDVPRARTACIT